MSATLTLGIAGASAATQVQKNVFAYDIRVNATDKASPKVSYKLNGTASDVTVLAYADGKQVASVKGGTAQSNTVTVPLSGYTGKITFKVSATTKTTVSTPTIIKEGNSLSVTNVSYGYPFNVPMGLAVNNSTESNSFGQILVAEFSAPSTSTYHSSSSGSGRGNSIYAFDPQMQPIQNAQASNKYGFSAGLDVSTKGEFNRLRFSEDGRLFMYSLVAKEGCGVYELTTPNVDASHAEQLNAAATKVISLTAPTTEISTGSASAFDVWGSGSALKIALLSPTKTSAGVQSNVAANFYNLGTNKSWTGNPSITIAKTSDGIKYFQRSQYMSAGWDKDGKGVTFFGYASTPATGDQTVLHYNMSGSTPSLNLSYPTTPTFANVNASAYNKDRTLLAVNSTSNIIIYSVSVSDGGVPTFTEKYKITTLGNTMTDFAFDYANNLYAVNRSKEWFAAWQLPSDIAGTSTTVPAPSSQAYTIESIAITGATVAWKDDTQEATLTWKSVSGATEYKIYCNGSLVGTSTSTTATVPMPMVDLTATNGTEAAKNQVAPAFSVSAVVNGTEGAAGTAYTVYHLPYPEITATATAAYDSATGRNDAVIEWTKPANGRVFAYIVTRMTSADSTTAETLETITDGDLLQYTDENIHNTQYYYHIQVQMVDQIVTAADTKSSSTSSNVVQGPKCLTASKPAIISLENYEGSNSVRVYWELPYISKQPEYFEVYRDDIKIVEHADFYQCVDYTIPNGTHTYKVVAVFKIDGNEVRVESDPVSLEKEIKRDAAVIQYGLEEVYNYPIVSKAEAEARGLTAADAFITDDDSNKDIVGNMHMAESAYGARGGIYRQGVFRNGKWYISQLHSDVRTNTNDTTGTGAHYVNYWATDIDEYPGGIICFDANDLLNTKPEKVVEIPALHNQLIAADEVTGDNLNLVVRTTTATSGDDKMFYSKNEKLAIHHYDGSWTSKVSDIANVGAEYIKSDQTGRVHYASATGDLWGTTGGKIYYALNRLPYAYVMDVTSGSVTKQTRLELNATNTEGVYDGTTTTENVIIPVVGSTDIIWQLRSNGYYYCTLSEDGKSVTKATRILNENVARNAGGKTFIYNDEMFFIHPSAYHSHNTGHFIIDKPYFDKKEGETYTSADFSRLMPIASIAQDELTNETATNSNGQWYGVEIKDGSAYIYLYVPGVRFAKYRLYGLQDFPAVTPSLDVAICHNDDNTDITHFDATITWSRPEGYATSGDHSDYEIKDYTVRLYDNDMKLVAEWTEPDKGADVDDPTYTIKYDNHTDLTKDFIKEVRYTAQVTPNFIRKGVTDAKPFAGETGSAQDAEAYSASIESVSAISHQDTNPANSEHGYRIDLNLVPADKAEYPEPVSYFTFEYSTDGGQTFQEIPELWLYKNNGTSYAPGKHDGHIPGTYVFDDDKATIDNVKVMASFYTFDVATLNYTFRATAHYADTNKAIAKQASVTTQVEQGTPTGVDNIVAGTATEVTLYPVPAHETVTVATDAAIANVRIYSITGALVKEVEGNMTGSMTIDVSDLATGNYLVSVNGGQPQRMIKN